MFLQLKRQMFPSGVDVEQKQSLKDNKYWSYIHQVAGNMTTNES